MKYKYQARTKEGKIENGTVEASSREAAAILLQKYDMFVTSLKEAEFNEEYVKKLKFELRVSKKELAIFSRQLAVMLQSRVPVVQSLLGLSVQVKKSNFKEAIMKVSTLVEEGSSLSDAFLQFPDIFDNFYVSLIRSGEASGKISETLFYLSDHLEKEHDLTSQIKSAMIYPVFVLCVLIAVLLVVMFFVMPKLVGLIKETSGKPPFTTLMMMNFYDFLRSYGWLILTGFVLLVFGGIYYFRTKEGKEQFDALSLKTPFLSEVLKKVYLARFAENVSTLIGAGISINQALKITEGVVNSVVYKKIISEIESEVSEGKKISSVMVRHQVFFPAFVIQMVEVGEETGKIEQTLKEITNFYQKEINRAVAAFTALLEPVLIIFLGIVVCMLAISVLQPLYGTLGTI